MKAVATGAGPAGFTTALLLGRCGIDLTQNYNSNGAAELRFSTGL